MFLPDICLELKQIYIEINEKLLVKKVDIDNFNKQNYFFVGVCFQLIFTLKYGMCNDPKMAVNKRNECDLVGNNFEYL